MNSVSVVGCGWLGFPLAKAFVQKGWMVAGTTTRTEKLELLWAQTIAPYLLDLRKQEDLPQAVFTAELVIVNIPPGRTEDVEDRHPSEMKHLLKHLSTKQKVILITSTSVYPDTGEIMTEEKELIPEKGSGKALQQVEEMFRDKLGNSLTILRPGGLIGGDRMPGRFLAGKRDLKDPDVPVNLVHREDLIKAIFWLVENGLWGTIYNVCCPIHPLRKEFYELAASGAGLALPEFSTVTTGRWKEISTERLLNTGFQYNYSSPIEAI